jgi:outer membrane protein assembly factor BamE (lipoprotein component of BamABCDE complex)
MAMLRFSSGFVCVALTALTGCSNMVDQRGNLLDPERLQQVRPGITTREGVQTLLGTPSSTGTFDSNTWYYISRRTEQFAFFQPKVTDSQVVAIDFDDQGIVRDVHRHGLDDARTIQPVARATPAPGREMSFIEQLIGNVGKFNTSDPKKRDTGNNPF